MKEENQSHGWTSRFKRRYTLELFGSFGPTPVPQNWVFVAACPNSGTTLLKTLLACHASIATLPAEGQDLTDQLVTPRERGMPRLYALLPNEFRMVEGDQRDIDVARIKRQWGHFFNDRHRPIFLDDSPPNAARSRWLQENFRPSSFIFIIRSGYAVSEGIRRHGGYPIEIAAEQWRRSNEWILEDLPHLRRAHLVRYEDLSERPDEVLDDILTFLQLDPLDKSVADGVWSVHGSANRISNMNPASLARLDATDVAAIERVAGSLLGRFGYMSEVS